MNSDLTCKPYRYHPQLAARGSAQQVKDSSADLGVKLSTLSDKKLRAVYDNFQSRDFNMVPALLSRVHQGSTDLPIAHDPATVAAWSKVVQKALPDSPKCVDFVRGLLSKEAGPMVMIDVHIQSAKVVWYVLDHETGLIYKPGDTEYYDQSMDLQTLEQFDPIEPWPDEGIMMTQSQFLRFKQAGKRHESLKYSTSNDAAVDFDRSRPELNLKKNGNAVHLTSIAYPHSRQCGDVGSHHTLTTYKASSRKVWEQTINRIKATHPDEYQRQLLNLYSDLDMDHIPQKSILIYAPNLSITIGKATAPGYQWHRTLKTLETQEAVLSKIKTILATLPDPKNDEKTAKKPTWAFFKSRRAQWPEQKQALTSGAYKVLSTHLDVIFNAVNVRFNEASLKTLLASVKKLETLQKNTLNKLQDDLNTLTKQIQIITTALETKKEQLDREGLCIAVPKVVHAETRTYGKEYPEIIAQLNDCKTEDAVKAIFAEELYLDYAHYFEILKAKKELQMSPNKSKKAPQQDEELDVLYIVGALRYHYKQSVKRFGLTDCKKTDALFEDMTRWALRFG